MKQPFDLEAVKAGKLAQDGRGNKFKFIAHVPDEPFSDRRVIMQDITSKKLKLICENGRFYEEKEIQNVHDLYMVTETQEVWRNVYWDNKIKNIEIGTINFDTKDEAIDYANYRMHESALLDTIKFTIPAE